MESGILGILGKIGFDWQVALANLINFLIIFFILKKYAFGPIGKLISERQNKIEEGLQAATKNAEILENTEKEREEVILEARSDAKKIIEESRKEAVEKREELVEQTKREVATMLENGKKSLEMEKVKMMDEAKKEMVGLVISTTEKILGEKVDASYSDKILKELN